MSIQIKNLTRYYGEQKALDDIAFSVGQGEIAGFLGPNGAGKSTTMKIATCFLPPSSGEVRIGGFDVTEHAHDIKKITGYLPEHNPLYAGPYADLRSLIPYGLLCGFLYFVAKEKLLTPARK